MQRQSHAALDLAGRWPKAEKVHRVLASAWDGEDAVRELLEIGTGAGAIASYFAMLQSPRCRVSAVDVVDQRQLTDGYAFRRIDGVLLPFAAASFDAVVSNHVIEHVGDADAQRQHLREIARVLRPGGIAYLAMPSRWQIREPHYGLAWLSWLPPRWRSPYLRWRGRGRDYDCRPMGRRELERMFEDEGFGFRNALGMALSQYVVHEPRPSRLARLANRLPKSWLDLLAGASPTHVYLLFAGGGGSKSNG